MVLSPQEKKKAKQLLGGREIMANGCQSTVLEAFDFGLSFPQINLVPASRLSTWG